MDAYESYRSAHAQLRQLLGRLGEWPAGSQEQLHALRGLAVLICAELEAYLRSVVHEALDSIADDWDALLPAQRRLMGNHILREMESVLSSFGGEHVDLTRADRIAARVSRLSGWLTVPGQFAREVTDVRLEDFHDPRSVARTVEKSLVQLREDGMPFFSWLGSRGADQASIKTALRELVRLRNDAAHQEHLGLQPTPEQIRTFFKITATTVRGVRGYVANQPSGVDRRAV